MVQLWVHLVRHCQNIPTHRRLHVCPVAALVSAKARALLPERFRAHLLARRRATLSDCVGLR